MSYAQLAGRKARSFTLDLKFLDEFRGKQPQWGYGGLGYLVYKRSYALDKPDGTQEEFWETVQRVVEGVYYTQKQHCRRLGLPWSEPKAQRSAQEMFRRMWDFKFTPPGRGLAKMGTEAVAIKGGAALNNCAFTSTSRINEDFAGPFTFLMDMSMLGVGVGGDTRGAGKVKLQRPNVVGAPFIVEDSREGWVALAKTVLNSFVGKGQFPTTIDLTQLRPAGAPLKTFGGKSSGPGPLRDLVKGLTKLLTPPGVEVQFEEVGHPIRDGDVGKLLTTFRGRGIPKPITSVQIVDVFNMVGKCVVAGGVRRTAEVMFGEPGDSQFIDLKNPETLNPLYAEKALLEQALQVRPDDPELLASLAAVQVKINEHPLVSHRWACVTGDTWVDTSEGSRLIRELEGRTDVQVLLDGKLYPALGVKQTGHEPVFAVQTQGGPMLRATGNHPVMTKRGWVSVAQLCPGDRVLVSDNKSWVDEIDHTSTSYQQGYLLGALIGDGTFTSTSTTGSDIARILTYVGDDGEVSLRSFMTGIFNFPARSDFKGFSGPHGEGTSAYHFLSCKAFTEMAASYGVVRGRKTVTPEVEKAPLPFTAGVIGGLFDADGYVIPARKTLGIDTTDKALLISLQRMLLRLGIVSRVHQVRESQEKVISGGRVTHTREVYRLVLAGYGEASRMVKLCGLHHGGKLARWQAVTAPPSVKALHTFVVTSVAPDGLEDVFDICVPGPDAFAANGLFVHNSNNSVMAEVGMDYTDISRRIAANGEPGIFWLKNAQAYSRMGDPPDWKDEKIVGANPCLEQSLEDRELCTLVETYPAHHDSYADFERTLKFAYLYAKTVTLTLTHDPRTNAVMARNRRIGCSMSGIRQAITKLGRREFLHWCDQGYGYIQRLDKIYSDWLGIPRSSRAGRSASSAVPRRASTCRTASSTSATCGSTPTAPT